MTTTGQTGRHFAANVIHPSQGREYVCVSFFFFFLIGSMTQRAITVVCATGPIMDAALVQGQTLQSGVTEHFVFITLTPEIKGKKTDTLLLMATHRLSSRSLT